MRFNLKFNVGKIIPGLDVEKLATHGVICRKMCNLLILTVLRTLTALREKR